MSNHHKTRDSKVKGYEVVTDRDADRLLQGGKYRLTPPYEGVAGMSGRPLMAVIG